MSKLVGKSYLITRRCPNRITQLKCMHQQKLLAMLGSFGSHGAAGLRLLYMTEGRFGQPVNIIHITFAGLVRKPCFLLSAFF